jgi:hypothetical protein
MILIGISSTAQVINSGTSESNRLIQLIVKYPKEMFPLYVLNYCF